MLIDLDREEIELLINSIEMSCIIKEEKFNTGKSFGFGSEKLNNDLTKKLEYFLEEYTCT